MGGSSRNVTSLKLLVSSSEAWVSHSIGSDTRGKGSVGDKVKCHLCEEIVHRYKLTRTRAKDNHMWKHFRNGDFNSEWEAEEKTKRREDAMRMMFDAFNGRNDIIPDEPDRPEDLNQIHHDEDDV